MQDATQAVRCLTVMGHLTGADLVIQVWPVALRIARLVSGFRRGTLSPETMFQFESALQDLLRQAGRLIVQWTVNHREPDDDLRQEMPRLFLWDGEHYRRRRKSPLRNLNCLFGRLRCAGAAISRWKPVAGVCFPCRSNWELSPAWPLRRSPTRWPAWRPT